MTIDEEAFKRERDLAAAWAKAEDEVKLLKLQNGEYRTALERIDEAAKRNWNNDTAGLCIVVRGTVREAFAEKRKCAADTHDWESMPQDSEGYDAKCRACDDRKET